jgi:sugar phosphate isomerase/epimerase
MLLCSLMLLLTAGFISQTGWAQKRVALSPLFVFNNGISDTMTYKTPEQQVALAARMGFDGVEKNKLDGFEPFYQAVKANGLKLYTLYVEVDLDNETTPFDPRLEAVLRQLEGTQAMPWLYMTSKKYKPSSPEPDDRAVAILREIAALAGKYKLKVALYPHTWFWLESVDDAVRIAQKVDRKNVGIAFNLPHYLATRYYAGKDPVQNFPAYAAQARPYLFALSVNGADFPPPSGDRGKIWETFIQPLGEGKYDTYGFLKTFWDLGFRGPVGLQCYNIRQDKSTHLRQSVQTYRAWQKRYLTQAGSN